MNLLMGGKAKNGMVDAAAPAAAQAIHEADEFIVTPST